MIISESAQFEPTDQSTRPNFPIALTQLYINGEAIDPTTEAEIAQVAEGTVEDVEAAVQAASWVNTYGQFDPSEPFGGYKMSGYGARARLGSSRVLSANQDSVGEIKRGLR